MSDDEPAESAGGGDDRPTIRTLDAATVQRIAAGEVVERPASVVKELVENSLDADASRVSIAVERGGKEGIRVRDDGIGMAPSDLELAVEEHATSKIEGVDDLEAGVGTLGFRGEALSTISAVSRTTIRSKPRGETGAGAELAVEGGEVGEVRPAGCPPGTVVEVEDLFFNTPARKKFLKTDATEFDHVNTVATQYALANPDVAVSLTHDGREVFATEGGGGLESAVLAVYGREVAESMVAVEGTVADEGTPVESVSGLVSHPETTRSGREYLSTFVNGRYVTAGALREAVLDAYGGQLAPDRYPFAVLFVDVPAGAVDVNVHPRKMEVRFDDESAVKRAVERAVEGALLDHGLIRSTAPRGRSAPAEAEVAPEPESGDVVGGAGSEHERASGVRAGRSRHERTLSRVRPEGDSATDGTADGESYPTSEEAAESGSSTTRPDDRADDGPPAADRGTDGSDPDAPIGDTVEANAGATDAGSGDADTTTTDAPGTDTADEGRGRADPTRPVGAPRADRPSPRPWQSSSSVGSDDADGVDGANDADDAAGSAKFGVSGAKGETGDRETGGSRGTERSRRDRFGVVGPTTQRTLDGAEATGEREFDALPRMRVLGQLYDTYVVAETDDGMVLVDQHAADERVNYERLRREVEGDTPTQALAEPVELELTAREAALFEEYAEALARVGFHAGRTGERTVEVRTVPAVFDAALDPGLLRDALSAFVAEERDGGRETVDAVADSLLADLACYPSITGNTSLTEGSVVDLLEALDACENPYACPHGRPVIIRFDREDIEDRFERDYPGHLGRRRED
ncbi:DNA mismatch repair endonuclease MutL [Halegenticoccus soli]